MSTPLIAVMCCERWVAFGDYPAAAHQVVFGKYLELVKGIGGFPLLVPALADVDALRVTVERLCDSVDGIVLPGSPSNVGIRKEADLFYPVDTPGQRDPARDEIALSLVLAGLEAGVPMLGICRGMQEMNVALGGDLHQALHDLPGKHDHRSDKSLPAFERYGYRHSVTIQSATVLEHLLRDAGLSERTFRVNSLHAQAISTPGSQVEVTAVSEDGVVEAIAIAGARAFAMGVQWHAEWMPSSDPLNRAILGAFRHACLDRRSARR